MTAADPRARGPARPAAGPRRRSGCCGPSTRPACSTPPTSTWRSGCCALASEDDDRWSRWRWRSWCAPSAAARSASTWPPSPRTPSTTCPWPDADAWHAALAASPLVTAEPPVLRLLEHDGVRLLYLDRYWREEEQVHADLVGRPAGVGSPDEAWLAAALDRVFPQQGYDEQRAAARVALTHATTVLTGGPGTGKTTTVAALLALCAEQAELRRRSRASASPWPRRPARPRPGSSRRSRRRSPSCRPPTAARLAGVRAVTLHRLLGARPDTSSRFRHHRDNRLPHDVVVVDETSMVSLTMMARLLEAVRPGSRLILVGDPFQLASVEAGAVLADLVETVQEKTRSASPRSSPRTGSASPSARWPRPSAAATPTGPSPCSRRAATTSSWSTSTTPRAASASSSRPTPLGVLQRGRGRRRRPRAGAAGPAAAAVRAPRGAVTASATGTPRSSAGWARRPGNRSGRPGTPAARSW